MEDLSLIPELGRTRRDAMLPHFKNVGGLANCDLSDFIQGQKTVITGIGSGTLEKFQERAKLLNQPETGPYLKEKISLHQSETELFFDTDSWNAMVKIQILKNTWHFLPISQHQTMSIGHSKKRVNTFKIVSLV
jgi:hypothetical protein